MIPRLALVLGAAIGVLAGGWLWQSSKGPRASASGASPASATAPAALTVEVHTVQPEALELQVTATGTLLGRESVQIVSELSRRLVAVRADEGQRVAKGDILFELDASDLRAELAKLDVQARLAQATLERTALLAAEGLSNQQELDLARARVAETSAERQVLLVTLAKTRIRAPFAGTLGLRRVSEGAWMSPSTVLCMLQDTSALKLDFTLPERYAGAVKPGQSFRFHVEGRSASYAGKIIALEPSVDAATRSLLVRGLIEGATNLLPGAAANVEVPLRVEQALLVPAIAVIPGNDGRRVFVARDGVARSLRIEIGFRSDDRAQVVSGLVAGDQVITTNLLRLRDDAPVALSAKASVR
ncbi:MAG: efflux RND transporter periplasmic adaptor subunit [Polyangiaceae bacterium]